MFVGVFEVLRLGRALGDWGRGAGGIGAGGERGGALDCAAKNATHTSYTITCQTSTQACFWCDSFDPKIDLMSVQLFKNSQCECVSTFAEQPHGFGKC
jgi:hypothetical protein